MVVLAVAPLAVHVPLAVLAGILLYVAWNMGEWRELAELRHASSHYRLIMLGTFFLTVVFDLTVALEVGLLMACVLFVRRMSSLFQVVEVSRSAEEASFRLHGSLFFGAVAKIDPILTVVENAPQALEPGPARSAVAAVAGRLGAGCAGAAEQGHRRCAAGAWCCRA